MEADTNADSGPVKLPKTHFQPAEANPYAGSPNLTSEEADVLGEYARLANNLNRLAQVTNTLAGMQPQVMAMLLPLERKLGLVLTLFKASVWATYMAQEDREQQESEAYQ